MNASLDLIFSFTPDIPKKLYGFSKLQSSLPCSLPNFCTYLATYWFGFTYILGGSISLLSFTVIHSLLAMPSSYIQLVHKFKKIVCQH